VYVLGIEAATALAAVAVAGADGILAERMVHNRRTHSVNLLPMIKAVLADAELSPGSLDGIAVSSGPGSFTGLRIGMSTAKTLAQVWNLQIAGVPTLEALAFPLAGHGNRVCPILNARKNEVYTAVYDCSGVLPACLAGPVAVRVEKLAVFLSDFRPPFTFLGDGVSFYKQVLIDAFGGEAFFAPSAAVFPRGAAVAELGMRRLADGSGVDPLLLLPEYVRLSEAEVVWLKKVKGKNENRL
jgi:tRNA threonylcarbamoyladenosine biosynthesis protein TsaB